VDTLKYASNDLKGGHFDPERYGKFIPKDWGLVVGVMQLHDARFAGVAGEAQAMFAYVDQCALDYKYPMPGPEKRKAADKLQGAIDLASGMANHLLVAPSSGSR
jgi:hypothetical protein